jgi:hypothetical protein
MVNRLTEVQKGLIKSKFLEYIDTNKTAKDILVFSYSSKAFI